jgi:hypothetical protein
VLDIWRKHIDELVAEHRLVVDWVLAGARQRGNHLFLRRIVDAETAAEAYHEIGHFVSGRCTGLAPHYREPDVTTSLACLECETLATEFAARHARPAYTREMHAHLADALKSYRGIARGWPAATQRLDRLASNLGFYGEKQRRITSSLEHFQWRHARALMSEQQRLDQKIQAQRETVARMRARRRVNHAI